MAEVITMLALSPTMDEGTLAEWTIKEGDVVEEGQVIAEVETDKATMEMESFFEGTLLKLLVAAGDAVPVGDAMAIVGEAGEDISALLKELEGGGAAAPAQAEEAPAEEAGSDEAADDEAADQAAAAAKPAAGGASDGRVKSSPLARRMAEDAGIELSEIEGSGPSGRVIKRDVEAAMESQGAKKAAPAPKAASAAASADGLAAGTQVPLS